MPSIHFSVPVGDPYVDGLLAGQHWATTTLTYSFPGTPSAYGAGYGYGEPQMGFVPFSAAQQEAARKALVAYSSVANLTFIEETASPEQATLRFARSDLLGTAWAYLPTSAAEGGDVWLSATKRVFDLPIREGSYAYTTMLHEIGHALGLDHAHENTAVPLVRDSMEWTVMSYRSYIGQPSQGYVNEFWGFAQSPMVYDIAAVQALYGANFTTESEDTIYAWSPATGELSINGAGQGAPGANRILETVWDGGGKDTYDFSAYGTNVSVDLRPGHWTKTSASQTAALSYDGAHPAIGNIANALLYHGDVRSLIENAIGGAGDDFIFGNAADNVLTGNAGHDAFVGGAGNDWFIGGDGADTAIYDGLRRLYFVTGDEASRTVTSAMHGQDTLISIEKMFFTDGRLIYDLADRAAVVYRMYDSAFDRTPDSMGLNGWIAAIEGEMSTESMAAHFAASREFVQRYQMLDNHAFVEQLYRNVLDREGDAVGVVAWTAALDTGLLDRGRVLAQFSESAEHVARLAPAIGTGIWDVDETAASIARLYSAALDRRPDPTGLQGWTDAVKGGGVGLREAAGGFVASAEFHGKYGAMTNAQFVGQLYWNVLERAPDAHGYWAWTSALDHGALDRGQVLLGFSESLEHQTLTAGWMEDGILV